MAKFVELSGRKYGMLTVVKTLGRNKAGSILWLCKCDCGKETTSISAKLNNGHKKSCGCYKSISSVMDKTKHGHSRSDFVSSEYSAWLNMIRRCTDSKNNRYSDYGGRGITVTSSWMNSFQSFLEDMGRKPTPEHTIDRIDVNGNYEPSNCRWATMTEQARNTRIRSDNKSGHRGVSWDIQRMKWRVEISSHRSKYFLGLFDNLTDAIEARKQGEQKYWKKSS